MGECGQIVPRTSGHKADKQLMTDKTVIEREESAQSVPVGFFEEFSSLKLRQIRWGLAEYALQHPELKGKQYAHTINKILKANKEILVENEAHLLKTAAKLNIKDPWNWIRYNHFPTDLDKMRVYDKFVSLVIPGYKNIKSEMDLCIATCIAINRFSTSDPGNIGEEFHDTKSYMPIKYGEFKMLEKKIDSVYLNFSGPLNQQEFFQSHNASQPIDCDIITFRAINKSPFLMFHSLRVSLPLSSAYIKKSSKFNWEEKQAEIIDYLNRLKLEASDINSLQSGLIVPDTEQGRFYGIGQTCRYEINLISLSLNPGKVTLSQINTAQCQVSEVQDRIFLRAELPNWKKFMDKLEGPVL